MNEDELLFVRETYLDIGERAIDVLEQDGWSRERVSEALEYLEDCNVLDIATFGSDRIAQKIIKNSSYGNLNTARQKGPTPREIVVDYRIGAEEMGRLTAVTYEAMLRNRVRAKDNRALGKDDIKWCEVNCTDLWLADDTMIQFASKDDLTMFLVARK